MNRIACLGLASLLMTTGCHLYFGDDDDCAGDIAYPEPGYRNPLTGQCESLGGGGGTCGGDPVPQEGDRAPTLSPDWAICDGFCESLDEPTCRAADGCRAIYVPAEACGPEGCAQVEVFSACWGTAPSGPLLGGPCEGLDAQECSRYGDCSAVHESVADFVDGGIGYFNHCRAEVGCDGAFDPPPAQELRNPETGKCEPAGGGGGCAGEAPVYLPDWGACVSFCTGLDEETCRAADGCRAILANECAPWTDCFNLVYTECWAVAPSGPVRGGGCPGLAADECSRHDDCVAEHDSDWSACDPADPSLCPWTVGAFLSCNDETAPPPPPPTCSELATEMECILTDSCQPIYEGSDCSCNDMGCGCNVWTFVDCQDGA